MVSCGIVGLANVGKSTLFNALLKRQVAVSANYPFTTIEPNVGIVEVPDSRLAKLAEVISEESSVNSVNKLPPVVPAVVQFVDIAGLVKGAHKGEGLGNQFLSHIREVDAIVFVLREFKNEDIIRSGRSGSEEPSGSMRSIDPIEDLEVLKSELLLKDLETVEKVLGSRDPSTRLRTGQGSGKDKEILEKAKGLIRQGKWLRDELLDEELEKIGDLQLLSAKKTIVVLNCDEADLAIPLKETPLKGAIRICAKLESELSELRDEEVSEYLEQVGQKESGLKRLIRIAYQVLGLMSFYTAGEKEVRAWTVGKGSLAPRAAGVIHGDFEKGFIAADVVPFDRFIEAGGWKNSRDRGLVKTIGRSEVMPEDCVVEFKFNV